MPTRWTKAIRQRPVTTAMIRDSVIKLAIIVEMVQETERNKEWLRLEMQLGKALFRR